MTSVGINVEAAVVEEEIASSLNNEAGITEEEHKNVTEDESAEEELPESYEDYLSDGEEEHTEDIVRPKDVPKDNSKLLVICGLPIVPQNKVEKLTSLLTGRVLSVKTAGSEVKAPPTNFTMPMNSETGESYGFAIVEYATADLAKSQMEDLDGYKKKGIKMKVYPFDEVRQLCQVPDELEEKKAEDHPNYKFLQAQTNRRYHDWLMDKRVRDQFVVRFAFDTQVHWTGTVGRPELDYGGEREMQNKLNWCEMHVKWSPLGTYLLTQHQKGVVLWGGPKWEKVLRISCDNVQRVQFSPNEEFLFTWNGLGEMDNYGHTSGRKAVTLWNIKKGATEKVKHFDYEVFTHDRMSTEWDVDEWRYFKWSSDDRYFARIAHIATDASAKVLHELREPNVLRIYDSKTLKSVLLKAKGIRTCEWSPGKLGPAGANNIIAYWEPEDDKKSRHASVTLRQFPSKRLLRQETLFNVSDCQIHWQNNGDFMCAHVERHSPSKKTYFSNLILFRIRDKDIPVEKMENIRETIHAFAWEPNGVRFCVIQGTSTNTVNIYSMNAVRGGNELTILWKLEQKKCTDIYWSPVGRHAVLAGKGQGSYHGALEFIDTQEKAILSAAEHFMCKHVLWDCDGRTVATAATLPMPQGQASQSSDLERGYRIWTFQGDLRFKKDVRDFYQFLWRPRPASLLTEEAEKKVMKEKNTKKYKIEDDIIAQSDDFVSAFDKFKLRKKFRDTMAMLDEWYEEAQPTRNEIQGAEEANLECIEEAFDIEQVIRETREEWRPDDEFDD
jgi:translation initiation factor 3 subunit B